jgi:hypothetical protein
VRVWVTGEEAVEPLGQFRVTSANEFGAAIVRACVDVGGKAPVGSVGNQLGQAARR